jgi:hypothetical protein
MITAHYLTLPAVPPYVPAGNMPVETDLLKFYSLVCAVIREAQVEFFHVAP